MSNYKIYSQDPATRVDWILHSKIRVLSVWNVAALSLGVNPTQKSVGIANEDADFVERYESVKKLIGLKLTPIAKLGYITHFPKHQYNTGSERTRTRMIDVLTSIDVLNDLFPDFIAPEFLALKEPLSKLSLPEFVSEFSNASEKPKKNQDKRNETIKDQNLHKLIFVMATEGYKYDAKSLPVKKNEEILNDIYSDVVRHFKKNQGLSATAIGKIIAKGAGELEVKK